MKCYHRIESIENHLQRFRVSAIRHGLSQQSGKTEVVVVKSHCFPCHFVML